MTNKLLVGGTFDPQGGKPSSIVATLAKCLNWPSLNGGNLKQLLQIDIASLDVLLWMPNISNEEEKLLPDLKKLNPKLFLIQSKRVVEKSYTESDIIGRLLASHSNLGLMITQENSRYHFKLLDPLGNLWTDTDSIPELATAITHRVDHLLNMTRIGTQPAGEKPVFSVDESFIKIIRDYGSQFTRYVNAVNPNRLLGNASTRCTKGFPSVRGSEHIYVTRRNVDKTSLSSEDFVAVLPDTDVVKYFGKDKPSVDTPIQLRLFQYYPNVNYMLHGHVYLETPWITESKIPCGYIEEFQEITKLVPDPASSNFSINLRGHGCLILAYDLEYFKNLKLIGRLFPEV